MTCVWLCITLCFFRFCNHIYEKEWSGYFPLVVFLLSGNSWCFKALPQGAMGWYAVYECGIAWSYSLTILSLALTSCELGAILTFITVSKFNLPPPPTWWLLLYVLLLYVPINSYVHGGTVSSPNHTFSWESLNKRLTSTLCTYFRL